MVSPLAPRPPRDPADNIVRDIPHFLLSDTAPRLTIHHKPTRVPQGTGGHRCRGPRHHSLSLAFTGVLLGLLGCTSPGPDDRNSPAPSQSHDSSAPPASHWAYQPAPRVQPPALDTLTKPEWVRNPIDAFVLAKLDEQGLSPSEQAEPAVLLRRITLALTGLTPTLEELDTFLADPSDSAYEATVDRLLASPRYAEHMVTQWLDLARYGDTDGFQYDLERPAWPWRDWALRAINDNMPYDEFTKLQLAGDLLPNTTPDNILATAFNRNHPIEGENGLLRDEFRDRYVGDRVETLGRVWLGLTLNCAKCHDHKYDPTKATDYYSVYDCFNQLDEKDNGFLSAYTPTQKLDSPLEADLESYLNQRITDEQAAGNSQNAAELSWDLNRVKAQHDVRVMSDMPDKRKTQVLVRGRYDTPMGPPLTCSAPTFLPPFPAGSPPNRLGLAQWLMMPENPLTHRVTVNRMWNQFFGTALVPPMDNFGSLTPEPSHADLLSFLSFDFVDNGFDVKRFHKQLVMSATFRQSSVTTEESLAADPSNQYHARGPRYRLGAEAIRDIPLFTSGLLVERFGGPPAFPYQPPGLWEPLGWKEVQMSYPVMRGDSLYRRSVYSFWKRILPPIFLENFDAPARDYSVAFRSPDTSPEQALTLLNEPTMIQAARAFSNRLLITHTPAGETQADIDGAIAQAFRALTSRAPTEEEKATLRSVYDDQLTATPATDYGIAAQGVPANQVFALAQVVRVVFNLSETQTLE
jgi:hypothetical protein